MGSCLSYSLAAKGFPVCKELCQQQQKEVLLDRGLSNVWDSLPQGIAMAASSDALFMEDRSINGYDG